MRKYNVGDKVRVYGFSTCGECHDGDVGIVIHSDECEPVYTVKLRKYPCEPEPFHAMQLTILKPKRQPLKK